jgi:hypothetical protein
LERRRQYLAPRDLDFPLIAALLFAARDNLVRFAVVQIPLQSSAAIAATTSLFTMGAMYLIFRGEETAADIR